MDLRHLLVLAAVACGKGDAPAVAAPPPAPPSAPTAAGGALLAFSANLAGGLPLHRDASEGADLFVGMLDFGTGAVTDVRLVAGGPGAQWFPDLSPDGRHLAYEDSLGRQGRVVVIDLATMETVTAAEGGRFPAFSPDGRTLFYAPRPAGPLRTWDLHTRAGGALSNAHPLADPCPVGAGAVAGHTVEGGTARPLVVDLATGRETLFDAPRFGHLTADPEGGRLLASDAASSALVVAEARSGGGWSDFAPLAADLGAAVAALGPGAGSPPLLTYPAWPVADRVLVSMQATRPAGQGKRLATTGSRLVLLSLSAGGTRAVPLTFPELASAPFAVQSLTCDAAPGASTAGVRAAAFSLGSAAAAPAGTRIYVITTARNKDPDNPKAADYRADEAAFVRHREAVIAIARGLEARGVPWNWQPDWNFLEGVLLHEVRDADPALLAATGGVNLLQWLARHGAEINPHSHESGGYNYADVAWLIEQCGVPVAPVVGGHVFDAASPAYSDWPRFAAGLRGARHPDYVWTPVLLAGGSTYKHQEEPSYTGVWRPSERAFHTHDPAGKMVAVGNLGATPRELDPFVAKLLAGEAPAGMYVANLNLAAYDAEQGGYVEGRMAELVAGLQARGDVIAFVHASEIPALWQQRYGGTPSVWGPVAEARGPAKAGGAQHGERPAGQRPRAGGGGGRKKPGRR